MDCIGISVEQWRELVWALCALVGASTLFVCAFVWALLPDQGGRDAG